MFFAGLDISREETPPVRSRSRWRSCLRGTRLPGCGKPRYLIDFHLMYLDDLPSTCVADLRRCGALTPDTKRVEVSLQGNDGLPVSTEARIVRFHMRSGGVFLQFICGSCGRRARILRLHAGHIMCSRCTGLRYWCEGKPAVRRAQQRIERLKATRFHGGPVSRRPGRTMERRAQAHRVPASIRGRGASAPRRAYPCRAWG
jgi:hypothetical protein